MKILYCHFFFTTNAGSSGTRSLYMARALAARGHEVVILRANFNLSGASSDGQRDANGFLVSKFEGFDVVEFPIPYEQSFRVRQRLRAFYDYYRQVVRYMRRTPFDVLFATSLPITAGFPGIKLRKKPGKKAIVFESRDLFAGSLIEMGVVSQAIGKFVTAVEHKCYRAADECIALAPAIKDDMVKAGMPRERVHLIPNGSDTSMFKPLPREPIQFPGIKADDFVAIYAGAHGHANGLSALIDAAEVLMKQGEQSIKIVLVGEGMEKKQLKEDAERKGLTNCVFIDSIPKKELAKALGQAHAGLMCLRNYAVFRYGTSPNKFFDYLASGLPVVVNHPGWVADMVSDAKCGVVVPPDDPQAMADALIAMRANFSDLDKMRANARSLAERSFDWNILAGRFCDVIEKAHAEAQKRP